MFVFLHGTLMMVIGAAETFWYIKLYPKAHFIDVHLLVYYVTIDFFNARIWNK